MGLDMAPGTGLQVVVAVPSFFLCPVSLELMRDPVTLSTGMTYDRASIERWLELGHKTCPTTNQELETQELIPNHTLRRLIQNWCVANQAYGVERIPTPRAVVETDTVKQLLHSIALGDSDSVRSGESLRKLWSVAKESERNRKLIAEAGAVRVLAGALAQLGKDMGFHYSADYKHGREEPCENALAVIALLQLGDGDKKALTAPKTLSSLSRILLLSHNMDAKVNAADVLHTLSDEEPLVRVAVGDLPCAIKALVRLLKENRHPRAVQASLRCLLSVCLPRRNRVVAIDCRAIDLLVELLPNTEKRNKELAFALLEILANCAEGREAISNHALAIPVIVKSMLGVSQRATEHAVATLWVILAYASNRSVINTALQAGAFTNLLMLLPSECSQRTKQKARDSLKLLNDVWGTYTCRLVDDSGITKKRNMDLVRFSTELV